MKRFIAISLLTVITASAFACAIPGTHNYYLFSTVRDNDFRTACNRLCDANWTAYTGQTDQYYVNLSEVQQTASEKGDRLMVDYIGQLQKYVSIASEVSNERWDYPTKTQLNSRRQQLADIRTYAFSKVKSRLRSQHALLYMRCNMMLGDHSRNISFWEQTASQFINTVYRDMMRNIYAGALLKAGRADEATQIFMEQGDVESLYTYYYKKRSFQAIRQEYLHNPNSPALPFLLQDFANNSQEAIDAQQEGNWPGKLFVRDIKHEEAMQMCRFARQVVREGKTTEPALWLSVDAWLQYLFASKDEALRLITEACAQEGSHRIKDNARTLRLFITADRHKPDQDLDRFLADELVWLEEKAKEERAGRDGYENHYTRVYDRLVHQVLVPAYNRAGRTSEAIAFLSVFCEQPRVFRALTNNHRYDYGSEYYWNGDYSTDYFCHIDTIPVRQLEDYLTFTSKRPTTTLEKWLATRIHHDDEFLHEVIGTKYIRQWQWAEAERHLSLVSLDFINRMNITHYMARRSYTVEPWMTRQHKLGSEESGKVSVESNQKLDFVREMRRLEQGFGALEPQAKAQRAYDLAVRYAQASYAGDAWYLTRYGKSINDEPRSDEKNMLQQADQMLRIAATDHHFAMKEKAFFAQAYLPIDSWFEYQWDEKTYESVKVVMKDSHQYRALQALADFERNHSSQTSAYVSHCDVLRQFMARK